VTTMIRCGLTMIRWLAVASMAVLGYFLAG
jgi:hypothetical protein